jgi:hypothetical protein
MAISLPGMISSRINSEIVFVFSLTLNKINQVHRLFLFKYFFGSPWVVDEVCHGMM